MTNIKKVPLLLLFFALVALVLQLIPMFFLEEIDSMNILLYSLGLTLSIYFMQLFYLYFCKDGFDIRKRQSLTTPIWWSDETTKILRYVITIFCFVSIIIIFAIISPLSISIISNSKSFIPRLFFIICYVIAHSLMSFGCFITYRNGQKLVEVK